MLDAKQSIRKETNQESRPGRNVLIQPLSEREKILELYIHIPFCVKKCAYCDFLSFPADEQSKRNYVEHLISEVLLYRKIAENYRVSSIFIGGGTPSCLEAEQIRKVMYAIRTTFEVDEDAEITIECNPGTLTAEKLSVYKESGINRLSIGLQSTDNEELKLLGRIHTYEEFLVSYNLARSSGFSNINIDLISSLPGQNREKFESTLRKVIALHPEHISAYSLIIEPGTPFYEKYENDVLRREEGEATEFLPDEEEEVATGKMIRKILEENGYHRYEISNYALNGRECRHNIGYWIGTEYLGLGLGASGYLGGLRYRNQSHMGKYLEAVENIEQKTQGAANRFSEAGALWESSELLTEKDRMEEFMFLGLRMLSGVSGAEFMRRFHKSIRRVYGKQLDKLLAEELMREEPEETALDTGRQDCGIGGNRYDTERKEKWHAEVSYRYALTEKGLDLANYCMAEFLMDD